MPKTPVPTVTRTLRFKIRRESYRWLEASKFVNTYQTIVVGDVSRVKLARTRMAKAVLDSGWGRLRTQLQDKGEHAGRSVRVVSERNTSRTCSACGARTGPAGVNGLRVRSLAVW